MSGTVNVHLPNPIDTSSTLLGGVDIGLENIRIQALPTIKTDSALAISTPAPIDIGITQLPAIRIGVTELPPVHLELAFKPTRVHLPVTLTLRVRALGFDLLSFAVCGESMMIVEDYVPHRQERCR